MELGDIQLTEADFNLLIEGLTALPEKGEAGIMMGGLVGHLMAGNDPKTQRAVEATVKKHEDAHKAKKAALEEEIILLKSKLVLLKRYLITNGALKTANKIVGNE